jgi:NMD protein affecting ribosome stability and mRNA decay
VTEPIFIDSRNHPVPADYEPPTVAQCDDCGLEFEVADLTDTIAGVFCADCNARFVGAARGLIESCIRYAAQRKAGS